MKQVVIDASIVMKAILPNDKQEKCKALIARFNALQPVAPALWMYEITSAFTKSIHFGILTPDEGRAGLAQAIGLGVELAAPDEHQIELALNWSLKLKRASAYDSFYLALAETLGAEFWTADERLYNAFTDARLSWLHWLGEIQTD